MSFTSARILNMGWIGLIHWIMISTVGSWNIDSLHYTFPSRTSGPTIRPHHFACDKVGLVKS